MVWQRDDTELLAPTKSDLNAALVAHAAAFLPKALAAGAVRTPLDRAMLQEAMD